MLTRLKKIRPRGDWSFLGLGVRFPGTAAFLAVGMLAVACSDPTEPERCWTVTEYNMETGERVEYEHRGTELPDFGRGWPWMRFALEGCAE